MRPAAFTQKILATELSSGSIELLKWIGLLCMTLGHTNTYLFGGDMTGYREIERLAFPLFGFVLGYNLARPGVLASADKLIFRLVVTGLAAEVILIMMDGAILPLNIMFTLAAATAGIWLLHEGKSAAHWVAALVLLAAAPATLDYGAYGVLFIYASYRLAAYRRGEDLLVWVATCFALLFVNHNHYAMLVIPVILAAGLRPLQVMRLRWVFYAYYPAHFVVILAMVVWL